MKHFSQTKIWNGKCVFIQRIAITAIYQYSLNIEIVILLTDCYSPASLFLYENLVVYQGNSL